MSKLIVENSRQRIKWFKNNIKGKLHIETHAKGAIMALRRYTYTHLYLDHDLGSNRALLKEFDYPNTGLTVVRYGILERVSRSTPIIIHSLNIVGARNMWEELTHKGYDKVKLVPFFLLLGLEEYRKNFKRGG